MRGRLFTGLVIVVVTLILLRPLPTPALTTDWTVALRVTAPSPGADHGVHETRLVAGAAPGATDFFDPAKDTAAPYDTGPPTRPGLTGPAPVGLLKAYFDHPEYLQTDRPTALWRDLRGRDQSAPKVWTLAVQPAQAVTVPAVTLWWTVTRPTCSRLQFLLRPAGTSLEVNMTALASYTFSAGITATRFDLVVQPDPTRLPAAVPLTPLGLWSPRQGHGRVLLTWLKNTEPDIVGYHVYRSTTLHGASTRLTEAPVPKTKPTFFDKTITGGQTYYYTITAVNADGCASGPSDELAVALP